ncbi:hypothetical protein V5740_06270 [Croceibacterium sp. TMG7-5b_MA50]|uniref:hypothetical protein n=1 Tax=Croceibacterium sp. TMG7-5b_MA50 TaxID=3121290 RepID=UPI0032221C20
MTDQLWPTQARGEFVSMSVAQPQAEAMNASPADASSCRCRGDLLLETGECVVRRVK